MKIVVGLLELVLVVTILLAYDALERVAERIIRALAWRSLVFGVISILFSAFGIMDLVRRIGPLTAQQIAELVRWLINLARRVRDSDEWLEQIPTEIEHWQADVDATRGLVVVASS